jgi:hypothetical protein
VLLAITSIAGTASAQTQPDWRNVIAEFTIRPDGTLQVIEWADVVVPDLAQTMERTYWTDPGQWIEFTSVLRMVTEREGVEEKLDTTTPGTVRWPATAGTHRYVIQSIVRGVVAPGWSIPRAMNVRADALNPVSRFRDAFPIWRDAWVDPNHRFLLDYHFDLPPRSTTGTTATFSFYWPDGWTPVREITPDTVVTSIDGDGTIPDAYRVRHLLNVANPPGGNVVRPHAIRRAAILLFPLMGLLFWVYFVLRERIRRGGAGVRPVDEAFMRSNIYAEAPEVIEAQRTGVAPFPAVEPFLRRLEAQRKIGLTIEHIGSDDEELADVRVSIRLLVSRDQLTAYERAGIEALMPQGHDTSSDEIRRLYKDQDFDPADVLHEALDRIATESRGPVTQSWPSRILSFALFWSGLALYLIPMIDQPRGATLFGPPIALVLVAVLWPSSLVRRRMRESMFWSALMLVPFLLLFLTLIASHLVDSLPIPPYPSIGLSLLALAAFKNVLAHATGRESPESLQRSVELAAARRWLKANPPPGDQYDPWLAALGLPPRGSAGPAPAKEDWGWALTTWEAEDQRRE